MTYNREGCKKDSLIPFTCEIVFTSLKKETNLNPRAAKHGTNFAEHYSYISGSNYRQWRHAKNGKNSDYRFW